MVSIFSSKTQKVEQKLFWKLQSYSYDKMLNLLLVYNNSLDIKLKPPLSATIC